MHAPAPYNVALACVYFPFIDSYFIPMGQKGALLAEDVSQDHFHEGDKDPLSTVQHKHANTI